MVREVVDFISNVHDTDDLRRAVSGLAHEYGSCGVQLACGARVVGVRVEREVLADGCEVHEAVLVTAP